MKKVFIFLVILFLVLTLILVGASFVFSQDNLIGLAPAQTDFYLHFDFNQWHLSGFKALRYFSQYWPEELLKQVLVEQRSAFKYNFSRQTINQIDEMAVLLIDNQPVLIYKFKPNFANFSLILGRQKGPRIFYRFLSPRIVILGLDQKTIDKLTLKPNLNLTFFYPGFSQGFFRFNGWTLDKFNFYLKDKKIFLNGQINNLSFSQSLYRQIDYFFYLTSLLSNENYLFAFLNQNNFPPLAIEKILKRKLAYYFPEEVERILPDNSKVVELTANPDYFEFQKEKVNGLEINNLKSKILNLAFAIDKNYIFLSSGPDLIKEYFRQRDALSQQCFGKWPEEIFYWRPTNLGIENFVISGETIKEGLSIVGCLQFK